MCTGTEGKLFSAKKC